MAALAYNDGVPPSPDTQAIIDAYSPSQEPQSVQDFFSRRRCRINNGQDPELQPEKFTPPPDLSFKWPTNEEAYAWAEAIKEKRCKRLKFLDMVTTKWQETPSAAASGNLPETNGIKAAGSISSEGPAAVPFQLEE